MCRKDFLCIQEEQHKVRHQWRGLWEDISDPLICLWTFSGEIFCFCPLAAHTSTSNAETLIKYAIVHVKFNAFVWMLCFAVMNTGSGGNYAGQVDVEFVMCLLYLSSCHKLAKTPFYWCP